MFKTYYYLTKPGIIRGNLFTATAGFFLASQSQISFTLYLSMLAGLALIIASACVFNNYIDRGIDAVMARTKHRALVEGKVTSRQALTYATVLGLAGVATLGAFTNVLALTVALVGLLTYVVIYGFAKRHTVYGTEVGSVAGAVPPVVGYTAVTGQLDIGAILLFFIIVLWQMPHFYAIAIFRSKDYAAAKLPVLPVKQGVHTTKIRMLMYIVAFAITALLLPAFGYTGYTYLAVASLLGLAWLALGIQGLKTGQDIVWARKMFGFSLLVMMLLSIVIAADVVLP